MNTIEDSTRQASTESGTSEVANAIVALRPDIVHCLEELGWNRLLGKARGGGQSLLEHTLAVFDVLCACLPFVAADCFPLLTNDEVTGMAIAAIAHDAGKAWPEFQAYLRGESDSWSEHVEPALIRETIEQVASAVGINVISHVNDIVSEAVLHDRRMRRDQGELAEWERDHVSPRWRKLADIVNYADSLASATDMMAAEDFLRRTPQLIGGAAVASYSVRVRGVSTTFLHEAALEAFSNCAWQPIIYFVEGTIFAGRNSLQPSREQIEDVLRRRLGELLHSRGDRLPNLAVGNPTGNFLPGPEYVTRDALSLIWQVAAGRARRKKQLSKEESDKYTRQWRIEFPGEGDPLPEDFEALRDIGPEACAFKLAKNVFERLLDEPAGVRARELYDDQFGVGAFADLLKQSTLMPVKDYRLCVRRWHQLPGVAIGEPSAAKVSQLDPQRRVELLVGRLVDITKAALEQQVAPLPSDKMIAELVARVMVDLSIETQRNGREDAELGLAGYMAYKAGKRDKPDSLQCAQCAATIAIGEDEKASAALGNTGSFSNRRGAFDPNAEVPICRACTTDLKLGQLSLGKVVETVIAVVPRRSIGAEAGRSVVQNVRELRFVVNRQLSPETLDPAKYLALLFPPDLIRSWQEDTNLATAIIRPLGSDKSKERAKKLGKALEETLGADGIDDINATYGTEYRALDDLAKALLTMSAPESLRSDSDIAKAISVVTGGLVNFAAVTPNLVTVALGASLGTSKDKDSDKALYAFGLATLFAIFLDAAVFVGPVSELRSALASRAGRTVYVPANGPTRRVLGGEWLTLDDARRWLAALQAALVLKGPASARSLLEILTYPSAGFAVRRVEQQSDKAPFWPKLWPYIEALKEVLG